MPGRGKDFSGLRKKEKRENNEAVFRKEQYSAAEEHGRGPEGEGNPAAGSGPSVRRGTHGGTDPGLRYGTAAYGNRWPVLELTRIRGMNHDGTDFLNWNYC